MAIQHVQHLTDEFSLLGPDATAAAFEPAGCLAQPTEHASSENLELVGRKSGLDEDEEEEEDDDAIDDDEDEDDLEEDDEDDDLEDEDDDDLEDDDDDEEDDDEEEDEEEDEDEVKPLKVKR